MDHSTNLRFVRFKSAALIEPCSRLTIACKTFFSGNVAPSHPLLAPNILHTSNTSAQRLRKCALFIAAPTKLPTTLKYLKVYLHKDLDMHISFSYGNTLHNVAQKCGSLVVVHQSFSSILALLVHSGWPYFRPLIMLMHTFNSLFVSLALISPTAITIATQCIQQD